MGDRVRRIRRRARRKAARQQAREAARRRDVTVIPQTAAATGAVPREAVPPESGS
jgi:hypothetical protein